MFFHENISEQASAKKPREHFCCPITGKLMADPVMAGDGYSYEKDIIINWLAKNDTSPKTGEKLEHKQIIPNLTLKQAIQDFFQENMAAYQGQFIEAMKLGNYDTILHLEKLGIDINTQDENGWTILHHAVYQKNIEKIKLCLEQNIDVNKCSGKNQSQNNIFNHSLYPSDIEKNIRILEEKIISSKNVIKEQLAKLHEYNFSISRAIGRFSLMHWGCVDLKSLNERIIQKQNSKNRYEDGIEDFLRVAIPARNIIQPLEAELQGRESFLNKIKSGYVFLPKDFSPLHLAVYQSNINIVTILLDKGATIEIGDAKEATPLFWAVYRNNLEVLQLLVNNGANTQAIDSADNNLLHAAAQYADQAVIDYLFTIEFLFQAKNLKGQTPAEVALAFERPELATYITQQGEKQLQIIFRNAVRQELRQNSPAAPFVQLAKSPSQSSLASSSKSSELLPPASILHAPLLSSSRSEIEPQSSLSVSSSSVANQISSSNRQRNSSSANSNNGLAPALSASISNTTTNLSTLHQLLQQGSCSFSANTSLQHIEFKELSTANAFTAALLQKGFSNRHSPDQPKKVERVPVNSNSNNDYERYTVELTNAEWEAIQPKEPTALSSNNDALSSLQPALSTTNLSQPNESLAVSFSTLIISLTIPYQDLSFGNKLGQGSFGIVYHGTYQNKSVAIKQLTDQQLSEETLKEFHQEVSIMARLNSPYIVKLLGACFEAPHYSLVMEYMPEGSLYSLLNSSYPLEWSVRYQLSIDIGEGMSYLHGSGIIHGDLKSLNVLLYKEHDHYRAKISDFGLAKVKLTSSASTLIGAPAGGTTRWMAPELFEEESVKNTKPSDVYSYGMVLWEIGARKLPFAQTRNEAVPILVMRGKRETIPAETPPKMASVIARCWKERAEDRPAINQAVSELREERKNLYQFKPR